MRHIILIAHNLRSTHNVGSLLRTADGLGAQKVYLTGHTPYPLTAGDERLPHIVAKLTRQINKTALGAEGLVDWQHEDDVLALMKRLKRHGYQLVAFERSQQALPITKFKPTDKVAIIVGREVTGIEPEILQQADKIVEIPMRGGKESFNVAQAAAIALYHARFL